MESMKTAVARDKTLFEQAEALARKMNVSRSRLFALALDEYIRHRESQAMLEQINAVYADEVDAQEEATLAQMRRLQRDVVEGEW
jgi:metal-responsive CopG/Arc/MetJ family transcriptional regulator